MKKIINLLQSHIVNFPILKDWGMMEPVCITLAFENYMDSVKFLENLSEFSMIISEADGVPGMKKKILRRTPLGIFLRMSQCKTEKEQEKLSLLFSIISGEKIGERVICCPVFVVFIGVVPDIIRRDTLVINISSDALDCDHPDDFFALVPEPEQLGRVRQKLIDLGNLAGRGHPMVSAACFLYPKLYEQDEDFRYEEIVSLAKSIEDGCLETLPTEDIVMLITERFFELAEDGDFEAAFKLPNLENSAIEVLQSAVFYDEKKHLFMSDSHFRQICQPLLDVTSYRKIKSALQETGILQGSGSRYVSKMYFWQSFGVRSSVNMLKFNTELIEKNEVRLSYYF